MDNADLEEMFQSLGPVTIRRMFGGKGIYRDGVIFALYLFDEVMLKADAQSAPHFAEAGARQWVYQREGRNPVAMPYWSLPDEALDDPDMMEKWARLAFEAGRVAASAPTKKSATLRPKRDKKPRKPR